MFLTNYEYYSISRYYVRDADPEATLNLALRAYRP